MFRVSLNVKFGGGNIMEVSAQRDIEKTFKQLCSEIDETANTKGYIYVEEEIWTKFAEETSKILEEYRSRGNTINLNYIRHNYHSRLVWKMLAEGKPCNAVIELKDSCVFLLKRHEQAPYHKDALERMSKAFIKKSIDISDYLKKLMVTNTGDCINWLSTLLTTIGELQRSVSELEDKEIVEYIKEWWIPIVRAIQRTVIGFINTLDVRSRDTIADINEMLDSIKKLTEFVSTFFDELPKVIYPNYAIMYRLTKKLTYFYLRALYFSGDPSVEKEAEDEIKRLLPLLREYSRRCATYFKRYYRATISRSNYDARRSSLESEELGYEIDQKFSEYLLTLHYEKNVVKAFKKLDNLYKYIITKVLIENVKVKHFQLKYFTEELMFLSSFLKIVLIKEDLIRTKNRYFKSDDWRHHMLDNICSLLENNAISLFKYGSAESIQQNVELKVVTRAFTGGFSVYIVSELIRKIVSERILENLKQQVVKEHLVRFVECIAKVTDPKDIEVYYKFDPTDSKTTDIDIKVGNVPIFIKMDI